MTKERKSDNNRAPKHPKTRHPVKRINSCYPGHHEGNGRPPETIPANYQVLHKPNRLKPKGKHPKP